LPGVLDESGHTSSRKKRKREKQNARTTTEKGGEYHEIPSAAGSLKK